jgi:organic radical activating enzyme
MIHTSPTDEALPLMESFYTIQGEGYWQGHAAFFIRLAGCNVGCHWCDVKESWDASVHTSVPVSEIAHKAMLSQSSIAVITGGEPLMYPLDNLCARLHANGIRTHLETSGVYKLSGCWDWICFSPKKFKEPHSDVYTLAHELKIIVYNHSDFEFAEKHASLVNSNCKLYLQPEWSKKNEVLPYIIEYVKNNPRWAISLQIHKYMHIP